jgi:hypothetical protein
MHSTHYSLCRFEDSGKDHTVVSHNRDWLLKAGNQANIFAKQRSIVADHCVAAPTENIEATLTEWNYEKK